MANLQPISWADDAPPHPVAEPVPTNAERAAFDRNEVVRATQMFFAIGDRQHRKEFLMHLADGAATPTQFAMLAALAEQNGRLDLGIAVAKRAIVAGTPLMIHGYPIMALPAGGTTEPALLLAIIRQESGFDVGCHEPGRRPRVDAADAGHRELPRPASLASRFRCRS